MKYQLTTQGPPCLPDIAECTIDSPYCGTTGAQEEVAQHGEHDVQKYVNKHQEEGQADEDETQEYEEECVEKQPGKEEEWTRETGPNDQENVGKNVQNLDTYQASYTPSEVVVDPRESCPDNFGELKKRRMKQKGI